MKTNDYLETDKEAWFEKREKIFPAESGGTFRHTNYRQGGSWNVSE
jgi:hypothetical protein